MDVVKYIVLVSILTILLVIYCVYVIIDERKKVCYYKKILSWDTEYGKYQTMLKRQRIVILKRWWQLFYLKMLVRLKGAFSWKKSYFGK